MSDAKFIRETPWDAVVFGLPTWEILEYSINALAAAERLNGHFTIKVEPTEHKALLHEFGYYYCDTLLEPYCSADRLKHFSSAALSVLQDFDASEILKICHSAFRHGRYHRDFHLSPALADARYDNWLKQLMEKGQVYGLFQGSELAGFIAYQGAALVLHAVSEKFRGMGFAKYWWSLVVQDLLRAGHAEICSSISASNIAVLNLYSSLGFSFRKPMDVYHKMLKPR